MSSSTGSPDSLFEKTAATAARWMLGLPPVLFGLFHLLGLRVFATIVPHWMSFGYFWAALTGIAFILAGCAICSGVMDVLAARLLSADREWGRWSANDEGEPVFEGETVRDQFNKIVEEMTVTSARLEAAERAAVPQK